MWWSDLNGYSVLCTYHQDHYYVSVKKEKTVREAHFRRKGEPPIYAMSDVDYTESGRLANALVREVDKETDARS